MLDKFGYKSYHSHIHRVVKKKKEKNERNKEKKQPQSFGIFLTKRMVATDHITFCWFIYLSHCWLTLSYMVPCDQFLWLFCASHVVGNWQCWRKLFNLQQVSWTSRLSSSHSSTKEFPNNPLKPWLKVVVEYRSQMELVSCFKPIKVTAMVHPFGDSHTMGY